jgi:hypothetical protein
LEFRISNQKNIIGSFKTNLGEIVGSKNQILSAKIANTSIEMIIQCEEKSNTGNFVFDGVQFSHNRNFRLIIGDGSAAEKTKSNCKKKCNEVSKKTPFH